MACPWWDNDKRGIGSSLQQEQKVKIDVELKGKSHDQYKGESKAGNYNATKKEQKEPGKSIYRRGFHKGYERGHEKGYESGYKDGYNHGLDYSSSRNVYGDHCDDNSSKKDETMFMGTIFISPPSNQCYNKDYGYEYDFGSDHGGRSYK